MKSKFAAGLLSLLLAFGLWTYVVNNVSKEETMSLEDVPVVFQNEGALKNNGLIMTDGTGQTVDLTVTGYRNELMKLNSGNVAVVVDLSRIYDAGRQSAQYTVHYPADVDTSSFAYTADTSRISLTVEHLLDKTIAVDVIYTGQPAEGYRFFEDTEMLDYSRITVSGPASVVEQMSKAVVTVDLEGMNRSISGQAYAFTLCDSEGQPVEVPNVDQVTTNVVVDNVVTRVTEVELRVTIQRVVYVTLDVNLLSGAGATRDTTDLEIDPMVIEVTGTDEALASMPEVLSLGEIDLDKYRQDTTIQMAINLPAGVTNLSGITDANISLSFPDLATKTFTITNIQTVNVPAGLIPELLNKSVSVTVRGPKSQVNRMTEAAITVSVSFGEVVLGQTHTVEPTVTINPVYAGVVLLENGDVNVRLSEPEPEPTEDPQADPQTDTGEAE